ncbi:MAG: O-methyltransferase [Elusimicrobia bacterium]|nr:O-methyltransferase [Elusimicrobiota bacterium]
MAQHLRLEGSPAAHRAGLILGRESEVLRQIHEETPKKGIPPIHIGAEEGQILHFLVQACSAVKAVEIGTLAGYSACWIAQALPENGALYTLEFNPKHAAAARENIRKAGLNSKISVEEGAALELLPALAAQGPFDFCFIDADKVNYPSYLRWAVENVRPGGIVAGDNAYLFGKLHLAPKDAGEDAAGVPAMREFLKLMADPQYFSSCAMLPTAEGLAVAVRAG